MIINFILVLNMNVSDNLLCGLLPLIVFRGLKEVLFYALKVFIGIPYYYEPNQY